MRQETPGAVIFDMDGVLLDSEPLHFGALNRVLGAEGYSLTEEDNQHILGTTLEDTFRHIARTFRLKDPPEAYYDRYDVSVLEVLSNPLDPAAGVVAQLERLRSQNIPLAVASSSRRSWVETTLRSLGVREFFDVIVTGDEIDRGKPHPDIYLRVAQQLHVDPSECVAIEDAPNGIRSAKRAGMYVVAVRTPYTEGLDVSDADIVVDSLRNIDLSGIHKPGKNRGEEWTDKAP